MRTRAFPLAVFVASVSAATPTYSQETPPPTPVPPVSAAPSTPEPLPPPPPLLPPPPPPGSNTDQSPGGFLLPTAPPPSSQPSSAEGSPSIWGTGAEVREMKTVERWYGRTTLFALLPIDLIGLAGLLDPTWAIVAYPLHVFAGPIVHWSHGNVGRGFGTLTLNIFLPIVFAWGGVLALDHRNSLLPVVGLNLGMATAQLIDTLGWSRETVQEPVNPPKQAKAWLPSSFGVVPMVEPTRVGVMAVGQF